YVLRRSPGLPPGNTGVPHRAAPRVRGPRSPRARTPGLAELRSPSRYAGGDASLRGRGARQRRGVGLPHHRAPAHARPAPRRLRSGCPHRARRPRPARGTARARPQSVLDRTARDGAPDLHHVVSLSGSDPERHQDAPSRGPGGGAGRSVTPRRKSPAVSPLVTTEWLAANMGRRNVRVVDGSWHMPQLKRDARAEFAQAHIPGAVFFDIDAIADRATSLPHMLPSAAEFARSGGKLGIGSGG